MKQRQKTAIIDGVGHNASDGAGVLFPITRPGMCWGQEAGAEDGKRAGRGNAPWLSHTQL